MTTTVTAVSVVVPTQALPRKNAVIAHAPQLVTNKPVSSLAAGNWAAHASRQGANASIATASRQVVVTSTPDLLLAQSTIFLEGGGTETGPQLLQEPQPQRTVLHLTMPVIFREVEPRILPTSPRTMTPETDLP